MPTLWFLRFLRSRGMSEDEAQVRGIRGTLRVVGNRGVDVTFYTALALLVALERGVRKGLVVPRLYGRITSRPLTEWGLCSALHAIRLRWIPPHGTDELVVLKD